MKQLFSKKRENILTPISNWNITETLLMQEKNIVDAYNYDQLITEKYNNLVSFELNSN